MRSSRYPIALGIAAVVLVAACSSGATPAPSAGAPTAGPAGTAATTPAGGAPTSAAGSPAASGGAGGGSYDFSNAATNLSALDSYKFSVQIQSSQSTAAGIKVGTTSFSGIVNKKDGSQTLDMVTKDASGTVTDSSSFVILSNAAYMKSGVNGKWQQVDSSQAAAFAAAFTAFRPEQLFSLYFLPAATGNSYVGDEQKNGIATAHYRGGDNIGAVLSGLTGVSGQWSADVWIAKDKGYLVHSEAMAASAAASASGGFDVVVDITDVNNATANTVTAPI